MVTLQALQQMDNEAFEHLLADIWSASGYDTQVTPAGADRGIDVIATKDNERVLIQAKRYASGNKVGAPDIREYSALYQQEGATDVIVATTSEFTSNALELAPQIGVTPVNGQKLVEMIGNDVRDEQLRGGSSGSVLTGLAQLVGFGARTSIPVLSFLIGVLREGGLRALFYGWNILVVGMAIIIFAGLTLFNGFNPEIVQSLSIIIVPFLILGVIIYVPAKYLLSHTGTSED